ncbi:MAG: hypothetical protein LUC85_09940 [Bacteroidales bacterium]|nr:hypothetical protein [Bacteroidales bacterium]
MKKSILALALFAAFGVNAVIAEETATASQEETTACPQDSVATEEVAVVVAEEAPAAAEETHAVAEEAPAAEFVAIEASELPQPVQDAVAAITDTTVTAAFVKDGEVKTYKVVLADAEGNTQDILFNEAGEVIPAE